MNTNLSAARPTAAANTRSLSESFHFDGALRDSATLTAIVAASPRLPYLAMCENHP
jgi:hypothetical protein